MNTFSLGQYIIPGLFLFILIGLIPIYFFVDLKNINLLFKILIIVFLIATVILFIITIFISYTRKNNCNDKVLCKKDPKTLISKAEEKIKELINIKNELEKDINYTMFIDNIESSSYKTFNSANEAAAISSELASYFSNCNEKEINAEFIKKASFIFENATKANSLVSDIKKKYDIINDIKLKRGSVAIYTNYRKNNDQVRCDTAKKEVQDALKDSIPHAKLIVKDTNEIITHIESIIKKN